MRGLVRWVGCSIALLALVAATPTWAQDDRVSLSTQPVGRVGFDDAVAGPGEERVVDLYVRVLTPAGAPVRELSPADIEVWEDDRRIETSDLVVEALEKTGRGITVVLAIDASGTMRGEPFARAKEAALALLDHLNPEDRVAIVTFAEEINEVSDFLASRSESRDALETLEIDIERSRHTLLWDGAFRALDLIRTSTSIPRRSFVILLSDGKDDGSDRTRDDVIREALGRGHQAQVLVFSVGYSRFGGAGLGEMEAVASETGGEFMRASAAEEMSDFFEVVRRQMSESYVVRYPSDMDGAQHAIRVTVGDQSGERTAFFPDIAGPRWPWVVAVMVLAVVVAVVALLRRRATVGRLTINSGPFAGTQVSLKKGKTLIGSLEDNHLVLPGSKVSRYHAEIVVRGRVVEITDLDSTNGTMINGRKVKRGPLEPGDRITIADVEIDFEG